MDHVKDLFGKKDKREKPSSSGTDRKADKKGRSGSNASSTRTKPPDSKLTKVIQEPIPDEKQLNEMFEQLIVSLGVGPEQRVMMQNMRSADKWTLILQDREKHKGNSGNFSSPGYFADLLRGPLVTVHDLESLRIQLANEPVRWANEFVRLGGVPLLFKKLGEFQRKPKKSSEDLEVLTEFTRCLKQLMQVKAGLDALIATDGAIDQLIGNLDFVSDRVQSSILESLAALSCPDLVPDGHQVILRALREDRPEIGHSRLQQVLQFLIKDQYSLELKVSSLTLINALINYTPSLEARKEFRDELGIWETLAALKKKVVGPHSGEEKLHALETQLYVFEEALEEDNGGAGVGLGAGGLLLGAGARGRTEPKESAVELFNTLLAQVRASQNTVLDLLVALLQHLTMVRKDGRLGRVAWELIDRFVSVLAVSPPAIDVVDLGKSVLDALKTNKDLLQIASNKANTKSIRADSSLSTDQKLDEMEKLAQRLTIEVDDLKGQLAHAGGGTDAAAAGALADMPLSADGGEETAGGSVPPPPPPLPGGKGPPPPPPPPGKGPPPPPGAKAKPALPKKPVIKPRVPMKQLHWTKVPDRLVPKSIWTELNDEHVRVDPDLLETLFAANAPPPKPADTDDPSKPTKVIQLLDTKRHNNISIMLSKFKDVDFVTLRKAIVDLDEQLLSGDNLIALKQFTPTADEIALLQPYVHSPNRDRLGVPEKYFLEVLTVPRIDTRLEAFFVHETFRSKAALVRGSLANIAAAVRELRHSQRFARLLEVVLSIGNYLNGSTFRGGAYGFKLDALLKLTEIKTHSNRETLMNFLAELCELQFADLQQVATELPHLESATKEPLQQLQADVASMRKGLLLCEKELGQFPPESTDRLKQLLTRFCEPALAELETLDAQLKEVEKQYKELAAYFGEDETTDSQTFFLYAWRFVSGLEKAKGENVRRRVLAAKAVQAQAAAAAKKRELMEKRAAKLAASGQPPPAPEVLAAKLTRDRGRDKEKGLLDQQLQRMRAGFIQRQDTVSGGSSDDRLQQEAMSMFERMRAKREAVHISAVVAADINANAERSSTSPAESASSPRNVQLSKPLPLPPSPKDSSSVGSVTPDTTHSRTESRSDASVAREN